MTMTSDPRVIYSARVRKLEDDLERARIRAVKAWEDAKVATDQLVNAENRLKSFKELSR